MKGIIFLLPFLYLSCQQDSKTYSLIDEYLEGQAKYFRFNGNVLVAEKGKIIYQRSFGYADYGTHQMLNDSSVFELASVSKQFTAMGIMMLKERGKLSYSDSLRKFFPELPYPGITIRHLLTHTSGLPDYMEAMDKKWDHHKIAFNNDMIAFLSSERPPAYFRPGEKWEYCNTGYVLLASIIEKISGQSFSEFMTKNIFQPLGMKHSLVYNTRRSGKERIPNYALGYSYSDSLNKFILPDDDPKKDAVYYLDGIQGDGVINSTTGDLLKWDRALYHSSLVNPQTLKEGHSAQVSIGPDSSAFYGFGVVIRTHPGRGKMVMHSGGWPGYLTWLCRFVDRDKTIIVLSNNESNSQAIGNAISSILFEDAVKMPYVHKELPMDSLAIAQFAGNYQSSSKIRLERRGNKLFRVNSTGQQIELKAEASSKFFYTDGTDRQIEFDVDNRGRIRKAWNIIYGVRTEIKKID